MSKNLDQIYTANPITSNASTDLMYFMQSPYSAGTDAGMTYANFAGQFGAPYTPAALTEVNDTNVTLTLGGSPTTALLRSVSITVGWSGTLAPSRGGLGVASPTAHGVLIGEGTSAVNPIVLSAGQLLIGTTSGDPAAAAINSGSGILVANSSGAITISTTGGGVAWSSISGTTQAAAVNTGYIVANAGQTTITLPATAAIGDTVKIRGLGAAGWVLAANTGQTIKAGSQTTSSAGSLTSAEQYDNIDVTCIVANTTWSVSAMSPNSGFTYA